GSWKTCRVFAVQPTKSERCVVARRRWVLGGAGEGRVSPRQEELQTLGVRESSLGQAHSRLPRVAAPMQEQVDFLCQRGAPSTRRRRLLRLRQAPTAPAR